MSEPPGSLLDEIFAQALTRTDQDRDIYLDQACAGDTDLRRELDELLAARADAEPFFEDLAANIAQSATLELEMATRPRIQVGAYRAEEAIGRGSMSVVYRATRAEGGFQQEVALKLLHLDMQRPQIQARFLAERQLLARFQHPNIARLFDGGVTDEGRPYIVMELIDGRPITAWCREAGLSLEASLRLFLQVVEAVSYLHRNLVVHRDLKPSNILVRNDGVVKLLDFGIAKLLAEDEEVAEKTLTSERFLTPVYASPEQLAGKAITTATDVYSLGVVLYELLTGRVPHERVPIEDVAAKRITTTSPSEALLQEHRAGGAKLPQWRRLPKDLDNICLMALRAEPERRYVSVERLGQDIERHLDDLPVMASPDTLGYRVEKFVQRHKKAVVSALVVVLLLIAGLVREKALRGQAEEALLKAEAVSTFLSDLFSAADPAQAQGDEVTVTEVLQRAEDLFAEGRSFGGHPAVESELRLVLGRTYQALGGLTDARMQIEEALRLAGGLNSENPTAMAAAELLGRTQSLDLKRRETLLLRVIEVRQATLGPEHDDTLSATSALAGVLLQSDRYEEAETLDQHVFEIRKRVFGLDHPATLKAANNLAADFFSTARYLEAAKLYEDALLISREQIGASHPATLRLIANLGATYSVLGRYQDAEALQREVVDEQLRVLGDRHHRTGMSMHNLGLLLRRQGRMTEAETWLRRAVDARAEGNPAGYLYSRSFLADTLRDLGQLSTAETLYLETLSDQKELLKPDHPDTFRTAAGLAELYRLRGELEQADKLAMQVLVDQLQIRGEKHLNAADTLDLLARIRTGQGRFEAALDHVDRAHALRQEVFAADHPAMLLSRLERARILVLTDPDTARVSLEGLANALAAALGPDHPGAEEARMLMLSN